MRNCAPITPGALPRVEFSPEARADLLALYEVIFREAGGERAGAYPARIERCCATLVEFPLAGRDRGAGLRSLGFERRASIVYRPDPGRILILRILYAGRSN